MCESAVMQNVLNLSDSGPNWSHFAWRDYNSENQLDFVDKFESGNSSMLEISNSIGQAKSFGYNPTSTSPYRFQLEQDVQQLRQQLREEKEMHAILENAVEHTALTSSSLLCLPHNAKELLSGIATLEITVSKLEQEMISLHFQLSQERNERRLVEYRMKNSPSNPQFLGSPDIVKRSNMVESGTLIQDKKVSIQKFQHVVVGKLNKEMPIKDLWNHPNHLSEEMVQCMKNIFISLAGSTNVSSKSSALDIHSSPLSPHGPLSNSSLWSLSERSMDSSWVQSPEVDLPCISKVLATKNACDPYRVRGKLSWADVGNYSSAVEVSWMLVGKTQLEYASGALRRFRSLVEQLAKVNPIHLNCNEKLAFWINIYNALIMHAFLAYGVPRSELKLFSLMQKAAYTIGGHSFSAAVIEYVILKMKPPVHRPQTALLLALHKMKVPEQQQNFSIDTLEPLVVFALSCGMYSSPAVRIYTAKNVRDELQEAQCDFIRASVGVSSKGRLLVPKMLHCFARGFVDDSNLAVWISRYLPPHQAAFVEQCVTQRQHSFLSSRNCGILPFDSCFRYLFLPDEISPCCHSSHL